jgi:hypothetical protein
VAEQRVEQGADHDGVGHVVLVLDDPGMLPPAGLGHLVRLVFGIQAALVPDIPLVEGQVDVLLVLSLSADGISGGDD